MTLSFFQTSSAQTPEGSDDEGERDTLLPPVSTLNPSLLHVAEPVRSAWDDVFEETFVGRYADFADEEAIRQADVDDEERETLRCPHTLP